MAALTYERLSTNTSRTSPFVVNEEEDLPLPEGWTKMESRSKKGKVYYFNSNTGESVWEHPLKPSTKKKKKNVKKGKAVKDAAIQEIERDTSEWKQVGMHKCSTCVYKMKIHAHLEA